MINSCKEALIILNLGRTYIASDFEARELAPNNVNVCFLYL